ncbi:MAG: hypothetical protein ACT4PL_00530 [Phycisphaerales bacterium]
MKNPLLRGMRLSATMGLVLIAMTGGCAPSEEVLTRPFALSAPYPVLSPLPLWAVAPLNNESGTSAVDALALTDTVIGKVSEVQGLATIPLNRTLAAMRALRISAIRSPEDARRVADALGADAIVVGSITAYDPYNPPKLGITLGLFSGGKSRVMGTAPSESGLDPAALQRAATEGGIKAATPRPEAESIVSTYLDANNHGVLLDLQGYAAGRHDRTGPLGWRKYLVSMDLYAEFAAFQTVERLLVAEQARVSGLATAGTP